MKFDLSVTFFGHALVLFLYNDSPLSYKDDPNMCSEMFKNRT